MSGRRCKQVSLIGLLFQEFRKVSRNLWQPEKRDNAVFAGLRDQGGRIEIRPGVFCSQHEGRATVARKNVAHDERAAAVIALDEQLGFAEHADIDTSGAPPRRFCPMESVPFDDVADAAILLFVKPLFCCRKMPGGLHPLLFLATPEDDGVYFEQEPKIPHRKQIEALRHQAVYELVASQHVLDEAVLKRVPPGFEHFINLREVSLQIPKGGFDRRQI